MFESRDRAERSVRTFEQGATLPRCLLLGIALSTSLTVATVLAAPTQSADEVKQTVDESVQIRQDTQRSQDDWEAERTQLIARFRAAQSTVTYLEDRKAVEQERVDALESRIAELERRLDESRRLEASLQDSLGALLTHLEETVALDLPFLPAERSARLAALRTELARPDETGAEKLRRMLEALLIEAQYGGTVEVYQDRIEIADEPIHADILRLGRLSLFWLTPAGDRGGTFDQDTATWIELPGKYRRTLRLAMEMASRLRPIQIVDLPLGKVAP